MIEQTTAIYVAPMKTYARCKRVLMFSIPELHTVDQYLPMIFEMQDTHVNRE